MIWAFIFFFIKNWGEAKALDVFPFEGGCIIAGRTTGGEGFYFENAGGSDAVMVRYDNNGNQLWVTHSSCGLGKKKL